MFNDSLLCGAGMISRTSHSYFTERCGRVLLCILCMFVFIAPLHSQSGDEGYIIDQRTQWVAMITSPELIQLFVDEFYLFEEKITKIEVIDADNNGFSRGDLIRTYPSEMIYFLDDPSERLQSEMDRWKFQANFNVTLENTQTPERLEKIPVQKAQYAIVASFLRGVKRNYKNYPLKAWIVRNDSTMTFEMWGYSDTDLEYTPMPPSGYDFIVVHKTVKDTLYIPE